MGIWRIRSNTRWSSNGLKQINAFWWIFSIFQGSNGVLKAVSYAEAVANGLEALESLVIAYEATGDPLPKPNVIQ